MSNTREAQGSTKFWSFYYNGKIAWEHKDVVTVRCLETGEEKKLDIRDQVRTRGRPRWLKLSDQMLLVAFTA